jgi:hypothetical protein
MCIELVELVAGNGGMLSFCSKDETAIERHTKLIKVDVKQLVIILTHGILVIQVVKHKPKNSNRSGGAQIEKI